MTLVALTLLSLCGLLCLAHTLAVTWAPLAYRGEIARPLRLDASDSFGRWLLVAMLLLAAGTSFLIYQLRRYRNDDFNGRYRLWRLIVALSLVASVHALVSLIDWTGALLDLAFGRRVALAGSDWVRLVVFLGGAILALRLIAEVRRCIPSLIAMLAATLVMAIPEAAKWNVMSVDTISNWIIVTSAPLIACTLFVLGLTIYLRMLYREVRGIYDQPITATLRGMGSSWFSNATTTDDLEEETLDDDDEADEPVKKRRWWRRSQASQDPETDSESSSTPADTDSSTRANQNSKPRHASSSPHRDEPVEASDTTSSGKRSRRRWFGLGKSKSIESKEPNEGSGGRAGEASESEESESKSKKPAKKRRRFSLRLKPAKSQENSESPEQTPDDKPLSSRQSRKARRQADQAAANTEDDSQKSPRRGLKGWFRGKSKSGQSTASNDSSSASQADEPRSPRRAPTSPASDSDSSETVNADDIDWSSLSKSERRRLRKQLKRQNRAA